MANHQSIQFLRGDSLRKAQNGSTVLLAGQPFYETTNNKLYVGNGSTPLNNLKAVNDRHITLSYEQFSITSDDGIRIDTPSLSDYDGEMDVYFLTIRTDWITGTHNYYKDKQLYFYDPNTRKEILIPEAAIYWFENLTSVPSPDQARYMCSPNNILIFKNDPDSGSIKILFNGIEIGTTVTDELHLCIKNTDYHSQYCTGSWLSLHYEP